MGSCTRFPGHRPRTAPDDSTRPKPHRCCRPAPPPSPARPSSASSLLLAAAILTTGRRTVANLLRTAGAAGPGPPHQLPARPLPRPLVRRSAWPVASAALRPGHLLPDGPVVPGRRRHRRRPPRHARSTARPATATRSAPATPTPPGGTATSGSSWPCWSASPSPPGPGPCPCWWTCTAPRRTTEPSRRPHRTPAQLMCRLLRLLLIRFPGRRFVFVGDCRLRHATRWPGSATATGRRLTLVSKLHPDANLFEPPPPYAGKGRPRGQGPAAAQAAAGGRRGAGCGG